MWEKSSPDAFFIHFCVIPRCFQDSSENFVHGPDLPEQPGGLSLHRLRFQHHVPPENPPALAPFLQPLTSHISQPPSAVMRGGAGGTTVLTGGRDESFSNQHTHFLDGFCASFSQMKPPAEAKKYQTVLFFSLSLLSLHRTVTASAIE